MRFPVFLKTLRVPWATLLISAAVLAYYFFLSRGLLYISDQSLYPAGFSLDGSPFSIVSHLFVHVGIRHLVGNLLPLVAFGVLLESVIPSAHVFALFFLSGILASLLFALMNAGTTLVGASAAIAGVMGASMAAKPKLTLLLLLATPLVLFAAVFPALQAYSDFHDAELQTQQAGLEAKVEVLVQQQRFDEAAHANQTLQQVAQAARIETGGETREREVPSELSVHLFGALLGVAYLFFFARPAFDGGIEEFNALGAELYGFLRRK